MNENTETIADLKQSLHRSLLKEQPKDAQLEQRIAKLEAIEFIKHLSRLDILEKQNKETERTLYNLKSQIKVLQSK